MLARTDRMDASEMARSRHLGTRRDVAGVGVLDLQGFAGNRAVTALLTPVQRCGCPTHPGCSCAGPEPQAVTEADVVHDPMIATVPPGGDALPMALQRQARSQGGRSAAPAVPTLGNCRPAKHDHRPAATWERLQARYESTCRTATGQLAEGVGSAIDQLLRGRRPATPHLPDPRSSIDCACAAGSPRLAALAAFGRVGPAGPLARRFFWHFLGASGGDQTIDVVDVISRDSGVRRKIRRSIAGGGLRGTTRLEQSDYAVEDFQFAFGAVDCVQWRVLPPSDRRWRDRGSSQLEVSMLDYYEFHPERQGVSQCAHAACVELVSRGQAKNFWMRGSAAVPWSLLRS